MSEKDIVQRIKDNVERQNDNWRFVMGREVLTKKEILKRIDKDSKFRKILVKMVIDLSIDILSRQSG